ncbi:hypothetical protein ACWEKM_27725 [Streptomyces sp. NPDC004752]
MLAKSVMSRARRLATSITKGRTAMTNWFGRSTPSAPQPLRHELHRAARFWPVESAGFDGEDTLPALELGGVLVYLDADSAELRVSADLDTVDQRLVRHDDPDETVPMHITVQGDTVFRA